MHVPKRMLGDALPGQHRVADQFAERGLQAALHVHHVFATVATGQAPEILASVATGEQHAFVPGQVRGRARMAMPAQVGR